jgi:membrane protease YdiL (CAAX protease family)
LGESRHSLGGFVRCHNGGEYSVLGIARIFAVGLLFSWLLWRTGSLRVTIFCHALNNSVALAVLQYVDFSD